MGNECATFHVLVWGIMCVWVAFFVSRCLLLFATFRMVFVMVWRQWNWQDLGGNSVDSAKRVQHSGYDPSNFASCLQPSGSNIYHFLHDLSFCKVFAAFAGKHSSYLNDFLKHISACRQYVSFQHVGLDIFTRSQECAERLLRTVCFLLLFLLLSGNRKIREQKEKKK